MNTKKERIKQTFGTFVIMFLSLWLLLLLMIVLLDKKSLGVDEYTKMGIRSLFFCGTMCVVLWFRMKYQLIELDKKGLIKLNLFLSNEKVKKIYVSGATELFLVRNRHSFIPVKFSLCKSENANQLCAPKVLIEEIMEN